MSSIAEFIETRESIETLVRQIVLSAGNKAVPDSKRLLDEARRQLDTLKGMVDNDVQVIVAGRLTRELTHLGVKVEAMVARMPAKKKRAVKAS
jgi:hypothetical protein